MNRSLNVFFGLVVCGGLIAGLLIWTKRSVSDECVFNPHDFYNSVGGSSYSTGSFSVVSGATDGGWTVPMRSSSSMFRHRGASSYAPAYSAPSSPIASSPYRLDASASPLYTTSSATMKSFGGGNAMGGGVSMSGGAVSSAPIAYSQSPIAYSQSPIALSSITYSPSPIASSPVVNNQASGMEQYAAASYEGIGNTTSGPRGIRGRLRLPGSGGSGSDDGFADDWLVWMAKNAGSYVTSGEDGYGFDIYKLKTVYDAWLSGWMLQSGLSEDDAPSFDDFLTWFWSNEGNHTYTWVDQYGNDQTTSLYWVPMGDIWPLLVIALLYALFMVINSKRFKLLLTTKRGV